MSKPTIALTMGDAAGIGPELVVRLLSDPKITESCRPFVVGDEGVIRDTAARLDIGAQVRAIRAVSEAGQSLGTIDVLPPEGLKMGPVTLGKLDPAMGEVAALCLRTAVGLVRSKQIDGVASAPMNKEAFHLAGYDYMDELVYLAELFDVSDAYIMGAISPSPWTITISEHMPFRAIADMITEDRILERTLALNATLAKVGFSPPRLAVAALNVHAGEGGMFGREELDEIGPAIDRARELGVQVTGPCPADTVFVRARDGEFDGVVCMYHDQANIARKLIATNQGATVFMGLPVPWTTTAHGTAFDKAGKGVAGLGSMENAIRYAVTLAQ